MKPAGHTSQHRREKDSSSIRTHITKVHEPHGFVEKLKNIQPASVVVMLLALGLLAYMLWVFFGGFLQR